MSISPRLTVGSVCSGIGAPECAWTPLGWQFLWQAEIEPFPAAVLAERFPHTPNLGDMTTIRDRILAGEIEAPDVLVGGTPCQSFSIAGLRQSLADDRGNLALEFCRLADAIDHVRLVAGGARSCILWENVPGVLSTADNAFGCFLAALVGEDSAIVPPGGKWTNAGVVAGPTRTAAWRVLDAQYFGLAQRRQRVFVVAGAGEGFDPAAVLLERDGLRRNSPPSREPRQGAARTAAASPGGDGGELAFGGNNRSGPIDVAPALAAHGGPCGRMDFTVETFIATEATAVNVEHGLGPHGSMKGDVVTPPLGAAEYKGHTVVLEGFSSATEFLPQSSRVYSEAEVAPTLQATGARNGNRAPQVLAAAAVTGTLCSSGKAAGSATQQDAEQGMLVPVFQPLPAQGVAHTLRGEGFDASEDGTGRGTPLVPMEAIAFSCKDHGADAAAELAPTLRAMTHAGSHANGGGHVAVAFQDRFRGDDGRGYDRPPPVSVECAGTLETVKGWNVAASMAVRRLTPTECERLQGFPDGWTDITHRGKPAADGNRYKALGNSMAVPVMAWIGRRIAAQLDS